MGSIMDSRYWTCPICCKQFDWQADRESTLHPDNHDVKSCANKDDGDD
jgi:hypothetical protein